MEKLTHHIPQTRVDEKTRKTFEEMTKARRYHKLSDLMRILYEDMAENYRTRGCPFKTEEIITQKQQEN